MKYLSLHNLNRVLTIVVTLLVGFVIYKLFGPINPADFKSLSVPTNQTLQAGTPLTYAVSSCRYVDINVPATVIRSMSSVSNRQLQALPLSTDTTSAAPGCYKVSHQVLIPAGTPAGCYQLTIKAIYNVAFYRAPIARQITSNTFCISSPSFLQELNGLEDQIRQLQQLLSSSSTTSVESPPSSSSSQPISSTSAGATSNTTQQPGTRGTTKPVDPKQSPPPKPDIQLLKQIDKTLNGLLNSIGL